METIQSIDLRYPRFAMLARSGTRLAGIRAEQQTKKEKEKKNKEEVAISSCEYRECAIKELLQGVRVCMAAAFPHGYIVTRPALCMDQSRRDLLWPINRDQPTCEQSRLRRMHRMQNAPAV
jgi:hypothetical protein